MRYERLLLDDFGVFQRAELDGLDPGVTVIAGGQRTGKTTFMEAVRRLGYGIGQGDELPPPADTYRLGAELSHEGQAYRLSLEGFGDPQLTPLTRSNGDAPLQTTTDLFGALSKQQYRQLYTLSLDQLQRLPPTIEDPEDLARVLLGAAYGSLADLPQIKDAFASQAHDIGRKTGHPRYGQFSDAYESIQEAQADLQTANEQVARYDETRAELDALAADIDALAAERLELNQEQRRLTVVQQYFEEYHTYRQLGAALEDVDAERRAAFPGDGLDRARALETEFQTAQDAVETAAAEFQRETQADDATAQRDSLLAIHDELQQYHTEIAGWRERLRAVRKERKTLTTERDELERRIAQLKDDWTGSFDEIRAVSTDLAGKDAVESAVSAVVTAREQLEDCEAELRQKRERRTTVESQLEAETQTGDTRQGLLIAAGGGVAGVLVAIAVAVAAGPIAGAVVGGLLVLVGATLAYRHAGDGVGGESQRAQLEARRSTLEEDIADLEAQRDSAQEALESATDQLETVRDQLGVDSTLSPEGVAEFYEAVVDLRSEIERHEAEHNTHQEARSDLLDELTAVAETVTPAHPVAWDETAGLEQTERLFDAIDAAATEAELAVAWASARDARDEVTESVVALIEAWDADAVSAASLAADNPTEIEAALDAALDEGERLAEAAEQREQREHIAQDIRARFRVEAVREAFEAQYGPAAEAAVDEWYLAAFEDCVDQFADATEVDRRLDAIEARKDEIEAARDELQQQQADLRRKLEALASEDDLLDARERLQEGASEIERLGEGYGTYRIAEFITERVQDRLIEETTGPLLAEASEIFARITAEYDGIEHTGELGNLDFEVLRDGEGVLESGELSRATAEQLFLAVRLARIRQIDTTLPVVLDDALTNFDPAHSARTLGFIDELARTHQVFFLTAHPAFVDLADEYADVAQYWRLTDGRFHGPYADADAAVTGLEAMPPGQYSE
jgi:uncharacterized protein YhaN